MTHATQTLTALGDEQRRGIILLRGQQILHSLPAPQRMLPAVRQFHDLIVLSAEAEDAEQC